MFPPRKTSLTFLLSIFTNKPSQSFQHFYCCNSKNTIKFAASVSLLLMSTSSTSANENEIKADGYYRKDGVRITHDPYAPGMAEQYGLPGLTDAEGFDPYADAVGAGRDPNLAMEGADSTPIQIAKRSRAIQFLMRMQELGHYD